MTGDIVKASQEAALREDTHVDSPQLGKNSLLLPGERLERVSAWGEASSTMGYVFRPTSIRDILQVLEVAHAGNYSIGLRGAGNSYGDATLNESQIILDLRRMNRILSWDSHSGIIKVEPGVTISQLWQYVLEDGWWPAVVPGTSKPTIGGCAGMNIHGKNAWKEGTIGDHITEFENGKKMKPVLLEYGAATAAMFLAVGVYPSREKEE